MKRLLFALSAFLLPQAAMAGIGFTGYLGGGGNGFGGQTFPPLMSGYPTLDYHSGKDLIQLDALGLISSITAKDNFGIAAAYYHTTYRGEVNDRLRGTVAPGLAVGVLSNATTNFSALVNLRMGVQSVKDMGVGLYVVPGIGIEDYADEIYLAMGGSIQLSVWMTGGAD